MEIALNKESKRKTPSVISFRDGQRTFGEDAQTLGLRFPAMSYGYLMDLLGKTVDNPIVELYKYVAFIPITHSPVPSTFNHLSFTVSPHILPFLIESVLGVVSPTTKSKRIPRETPSCS